MSYGPQRDKTCLRGFRESEVKTSLYSYRDYLENWNFACSKFTSNHFQKANNKDADQTARMRRQTPQDRFSRVEAHYIINYNKLPEIFQKHSKLKPLWC